MIFGKALKMTYNGNTMGHKGNTMEIAIPKISAGQSDDSWKGFEKEIQQRYD